jgi:hypothetical protein
MFCMSGRLRLLHIANLGRRGLLLAHMSGNNSTSNCSALAEMGGFEKYMEQIRNMTDFNIQRLGDCQKEICSALFGVGNPDVSGIGVCLFLHLAHEEHGTNILPR